MEIYDKACYIRDTDSHIQSIGGQTEKEWARLVSGVYENAKGNGDGWLGIAEKEPLTILLLFPLVLLFMDEHFKNPS